MQHGSLSDLVAATLAAHATHLAQHWIERAVAATPRPITPANVSAGARAGAPADVAGVGRSAAAPGSGAADHGGAVSGLVGGVPTDARQHEGSPPVGPALEHAEQTVRALAAHLRAAQAASLVIAGARGNEPGALRRVPDIVPAGLFDPASSDPTPANLRPAGEIMRLGWAAGRAAYQAGLSVHHVVRDADLLLAVMLADAERAVADHPAAATAGAAEAFTIARRLQRGAGRYAQAAVSGFIHALLGTLRERYRLLRHDLRNPLGTIRSALSLMEDESVPAETRNGPGIRAMVARNAGSLDTLITRSLDDAAATALLAPTQAVALRDVALAARREAREAARLAGVDVLIDLPDAATPPLDGAALELTLTALFLAGITEAEPGTVLRVTTGVTGGVSAGADTWTLVAVAVERPGADDVDMEGDPATYWEEQGLRLAVELARDHGAHLAADTLSPRTRDLGALVVGLLLSRTVYVRLPIPARPTV